MRFRSEVDPGQLIQLAGALPWEATSNVERRRRNGALPFDYRDPEPRFLIRTSRARSCQHSVTRVYAYSRTREEAAPLMDVTRRLGMCLDVVQVVLATSPAVAAYVSHMPTRTSREKHHTNTARKHVSQWLSLRATLRAVEMELRPEQTALILETDVRLSVAFDDMLGVLLRQLKGRDWDILFVGSCFDTGPRIRNWKGDVRGNTSDIVSPYLMRSRGPLCAHAAAYSGASAAKVQHLIRPSLLLRAQPPPWAARNVDRNLSTTHGGFDIYLGDMIASNAILSYTAWPPLAVQNGCGFRFNGVYLPDYVPPKSASWCDRASDAPAPRCEPWCSGHTSPWTEKCAWTTLACAARPGC